MSNVVKDLRETDNYFRVNPPYAILTFPQEDIGAELYGPFSDDGQLATWFEAIQAKNPNRVIECLMTATSQPEF